MPDHGVLIRSRQEFHDREPVSDYVMITSCEHGTNLKGRAATPTPTL
jgi:hypothetical protein